MSCRRNFPALFVALALTAGSFSTAAKAAMPVAAAPAIGVVKQRSDYGFDETVLRLKRDIAAKGIQFFGDIDHQTLGAGANLAIGRSTLLLFGNPPLGIQFLQTNPLAGLDWPVRMLVSEDADGTVWISWTDFRFVADRYQLDARAAEIAMAGEVAASIAFAARRQP